MEPIKRKLIAYRDHIIEIKVFLDEDAPPPWVGEDGHGVVTRHFDGANAGHLRRLGRRGLRPSYYYDMKASIALAKRDGWGISGKELDALASSLGRQPSQDEITEAAVESDFKHLKGWVYGDWQYLGYTCEIFDKDGSPVGKDSCWGLDDMQCMLSSAAENARKVIDDLIAKKLKPEAGE